MKHRWHHGWKGFFKAKKTGKMTKDWQIYYVKSKLCVTQNYASIKNRRLKKV